MLSSSKRIAALIISVALAFWPLVGALVGAQEPLDDEQSEWEITEGAAPGYVKDSACTECHEAREHSYQHSPMSFSFFAMTPDKLRENLTENAFFHEPSGNYYETYRRGEDFFQRRWRVDEAGQKYAEFERRIDWVIGSGTHARTYCYETPSGEFFQLPVSWYNGRGFAMSPGYDLPDHDGFGRPIRRRCMFCHNAFGESPAGSDQYGEIDRFAQAEMPEGISCQRCHGPGGEHATLALDPDIDEDVLRAAIVHPAGIDKQRSGDICFQCHLQPTSAIDDTVRRLGRGTYSFKPGEPLEDYNAHFDIFERKPIEDRFEINHHAYRLMQSPCFVESEGSMNCVTCHSPHSRPTIEERPAYYRRKCMQCHEVDSCSFEGRLDAHEVESNDCAGCHMPERRTQDVVLATATDHLIRRAPAPKSFLEELEEDEEFELQGAAYFFADRGPHGEELKLHQGLFQIRNGSVEGLDELQALVNKEQPETAEPYLDLGRGYLVTNRYDLAVQNFSRVTELFPERSVGWRSLGEALVLTGSHAEAKRALTRALELEPDHPDNHFAMGKLLGATQFQPALKHYRDGLDLRPNDEGALEAIAMLLLERGRFARAATRFERAIEADPRNAELYRGLGTARVRQGQWAQALQAWDRGAAVAEYDADFRRKLAFGYLTADDKQWRDPARALKFAQEAAELTSRDPDVATEIAMALYLLDRHDESLKALQRARDLSADRVVTSGIAALNYRALDREEDARSEERAARSEINLSTAGALRTFVLEQLKTSRAGKR
ncbi:MAG: tetratricopeptide (TPR) repeat protein [Planctomycetota bacterium]|jgi:tetratricopeptide (TPR) repeat protein